MKTMCLEIIAGIFGISLAVLSASSMAVADPAAIDPSITVEHLVSLDGDLVRLVKEPGTKNLYLLRLNGDILELKIKKGRNGSVSANLIFTSQDHGIHWAQGFAIGPDGTFYVVGNSTVDTYFNVATIAKGVPGKRGQTFWSVLAETVSYPLNVSFNHLFNAVVVSPDGQFVYVNSGARTDHGEAGVADPVAVDIPREVPLTASLFRLPADGDDIVLTNDRDDLVINGYLFAEGLRNTFDLAFASNGDLLGTENGPDRDMADELNWLRQDHHYGFPWRMGGEDNPQQFLDYDPDADLLLNPNYGAISTGLYHNDPEFPIPPVPFTDPIMNFGPDADRFRDPIDGSIQDAFDLGASLKSFTPHRSPLGLVFDVENKLGEGFTGDGFMLSFQKGNPDDLNDPIAAGALDDPSEDLVHLDLAKVGGRYEAWVTRIVADFSRPIDASITDNEIYVLEFARFPAQASIWKVIMPSNKPGKKKPK